MSEVAAKNSGETEFLQAVEEVAEAIIPFMGKNLKYNNKMLLERRFRF
jgi:glutamate dehydrogenase (NADP+)